MERVSCPAEHQRITGHAQTGAAQKYIVSATRDIHLDDELKPHVEDWLDLHVPGVTFQEPDADGYEAY